MNNRKKHPFEHSALPLGQVGASPIRPDPLGSYTGVAGDPYDTPVQDADDL